MARHAPTIDLVDESTCPIPGCQWRYEPLPIDLPADASLEAIQVEAACGLMRAYDIAAEHALDHMLYGNVIPDAKPEPKPMEGIAGLLGDGFRRGDALPEDPHQ